MPSYSSVISQLAEFGLTRAELDAAIGRDPYVRAAVINMTVKARDTWQEIWDEAEPSGSHPYETVQYRGSLTIEYNTSPTGYFTGTVRTRDRKAFWLEYGTQHETFTTPEFAPARKTIDRLNGSRGDGLPKSGQPSGKNWAGNVSS